MLPAILIDSMKNIALISKTKKGLAPSNIIKEFHSFRANIFINRIFKKEKSVMTGFTMIELLVVIAITLLLAATVTPIYGNFQVSAQINENTSQIIQTLRSAREKSLAGYNNSQHGVRIFVDRYVYYQGSSYASRDSSYDQIFILNNSLSLATNLGNGEANFSKGSGLPGSTGYISITHNTGDSSLININSLGAVEEN